MLSELTGEEYDLTDFKRIKNGYERIPIKTPIIKIGDDICEIADKLTKGIRREGDIITLASAVTALAEGRAKSVDVIYASPLAKLLSFFVKKGSFSRYGFAFTLPAEFMTENSETITACAKLSEG